MLILQLNIYKRRPRCRKQHWTGESIVPALWGRKSKAQRIWTSFRPRNKTTQQNTPTHTLTSWTLQLYLSDVLGLTKRKSNTALMFYYRNVINNTSFSFFFIYIWILNIFFLILTTWIANSVVILFPQNLRLVFSEFLFNKCVYPSTVVLLWHMDAV